MEAFGVGRFADQQSSKRVACIEDRDPSGATGALDVVPAGGE
jgi:hypothetical protein